MPGIYAKYPPGPTGGSGTVTSVGLSLPVSVFSVSGSPVTTTGTLSASFVAQPVNAVFAGPGAGPSAAPTFRALVAADIPSLPYAANSFTIIQPDSGTSPTASSPTDTLTLHNADGKISIVGNSGTKTITFGLVFNYLTAVTASAPLVSSGGVTPNLSIPNSSTLVDGYLSATNFTIFSNKQPAGNYITALTGDVTATGPGSVAATLATVNANVGTFTNSTVTVNAKGLITAASSGTAPVTSVTASSPLASSGGTTPNISLTGIVAVANGGTSLGTLTANNVILGNGTAAPTFVAPGTSGNLLTSNGTTWTSAAPATNGTVTSVAFSDGSTTPIYTITGSPVTTSGTLTETLKTQTANTIFAGPTTGAAAQPSFRALVTADLPNPTVVTKSANYTLLTSDSRSYFLLNTSGGAFNLTLPTPASGLIFFLKDSTGSFTANNLTLVRASAEQIDGLASSKIFQTNWGGWSVFSDGTNWFII